MTVQQKVYIKFRSLNMKSSVLSLELITKSLFQFSWMSVNVWNRGDIFSESPRKGGNLKSFVRDRGMT